MRVSFSLVVATLLLPLIPVTPRAAAGPVPREETTKIAPLKYPYVAATERADQIRQNYVKVRPGMTAAEVVSILGEPEEIRPLYEPKIKNPKRIGTTYWFIIERRKPSGSVAERAEKLVRVALKLNQVATDVAHWGF